MNTYTDHSLPFRRVNLHGVLLLFSCRVVFRAVALFDSGNLQGCEGVVPSIDTVYCLLACTPPIAGV